MTVAWLHVYVVRVIYNPNVSCMGIVRACVEYITSVIIQAGLRQTPKNITTLGWLPFLLQQVSLVYMHERMRGAVQLCMRVTCTLSFQLPAEIVLQNVRHPQIALTSL